MHLRKMFMTHRLQWDAASLLEGANALSEVCVASVGVVVLSLVRVDGTAAARHSTGHSPPALLSLRLPLLGLSMAACAELVVAVGTPVS